MKTVLFFFLISISAFSQTGIGTTTPNASAKLDVYSTNKGFLPPRVTLTSVTDATTIASPAEGLLVYNLGSVGLQAGYYYWNGANWATIATATSAGNGVTSMDMVKLYGEAHSSATGKISSSTGYVFTVPVSGRYLFDFTSTGTFLNGGMTIYYFQVRQGTTVLGSDTQTSYNNNVHVEYNGKVEVNLQAGVSYNVYNYTTGGSFESNDFDRVYYKLVAGNLPVTGQTVEYGIARYSGADGSVIADNAIVPFDASAAGNLTWSANKFTLKANKTYELESSLAIYVSGGSGIAGRFQIYDYTNSVALANGLFMSQNGAGGSGQNANSPMKGIVTPTSDIQVGIRLLDHYGPNGPSIVGSTSVTGSNSAPNSSYFMVKQIGSSAIVDPWVLSGTNTYNTTGNVGIGTNSPTSTLDVTGSLAVSGATNLKGSVNIGTGIGLEGGEIDLANAASGNTTLSGNVGIDVYGDKVRIFENGGNARGVNIDLSKAPIGASGDLMWKASGIVNRGVDITLGNLKARMASSGNASLQLSTVTGTYSVYGSGIYSQAGTVIGTTIDAASPMSISTTPTYLKSSYSFGTAGSTDNWVIMDTTNAIAWRITMILGAGVNNNLISIERLF